MPYAWIEPHEFLAHGGVTVYHAYNDDDFNRRLLYHYTVDVTECRSAFDIRELVAYAADLPHDEILRRAIDGRDPVIMAALAALETEDY